MMYKFCSHSVYELLFAFEFPRTIFNKIERCFVCFLLLIGNINPGSSMTVEISVYILRTTQLAFMLYINTNTISISKRQGSTQNYHDMTTYMIIVKK